MENVSMNLSPQAEKNPSSWRNRDYVCLPSRDSGDGGDLESEDPFCVLSGGGDMMAALAESTSRLW